MNIFWSGSSVWSNRCAQSDQLGNSFRWLRERGSAPFLWSSPRCELHSQTRICPTTATTACSLAAAFLALHRCFSALLVSDVQFYLFYLINLALPNCVAQNHQNHTSARTRLLRALWVLLYRYKKWTKRQKFLRALRALLCRHKKWTARQKLCSIMQPCTSTHVIVCRHVIVLHHPIIALV